MATLPSQAKRDRRLNGELKGLDGPAETWSLFLE